MRSFTPVHAMLALAVAGCGTTATGMFRAAESTVGALVDAQAFPGEFIVQAKPGRVPAIKGGKVVSTLDLGKQGRFYLVRAESLAGAALQSALASDPAVVSVGPNRHVQVPVTPPRPGFRPLSCPGARTRCTASNGICPTSAPIGPGRSPAAGAWSPPWSIPASITTIRT